MPVLNLYIHIYILVMKLMIFLNTYLYFKIVLFRKYKLSFIGLYEYMSVSRILFYMFSDDAILEAPHSMDSRLLFTSTGLYSPVSVLSQLPRLLSAEWQLPLEDSPRTTGDNPDLELYLSKHSTCVHYHIKCGLLGSPVQGSHQSLVMLQRWVKIRIWWNLAWRVLCSSQQTLGACYEPEL